MIPNADSEGRPRRTAAWVVAAVLAVTAMACTVRLDEPHYHRLLNTDEADYVRASSYGLVANYLATRERSGFAFAASVLDEYRETGWARPFKRDWDAGDAAALRHYHPPLALYPVAALSQLGVRDERTLRLASVAVGILACLASGLLAYLMLLQVGWSLRLSASVAAGLLTATSGYHALASAQIGAHAPYSLISTLMLVCLTRATQSNDRRWWLAACGCFGLALLTVPYWALLVPGAVWTWWWGLPRGARSWRWLLQGALTAIAVAFVAWPPFLFEAAFVKPILMYAGIVLKPFSTSGTPGTWIPSMIDAHLPLIVVAAVGLLALIPPSPVRLRYVSPTAIFVISFLLFNLRVSHMKPLYASDVVAPLAALTTALAGHALARFAPRLAAQASWALALAVAVVGLARLESPATDQRWKESLTALDARFAGQRVLVTPRAAGAMVTYYLQRTTVVLDSNHPEDVTALQRRLTSGDIDTVLRWGGAAEYAGAAAEVIASRPADGKADVDGTVLSWWRNTP